MKNRKKDLRARFRIMIKLCFHIVSLLSMAAASASGDAGELHIEQARINMPEIKVYYYSENSSNAGATAFLSDQSLTVVSSYPYLEKQDGTDYYLLVDISLSIDKEYFADIKQAIAGFLDRMGDMDRVTLITFGDQVSVVLEKVKKTDDVADILENLDNTDMNTHLFDAFSTTAELAESEEDASRRAVAIVISDGEDCSEGERAESEVLGDLQETGIPLYGMAVRERAHGEENGFIEGFRDFTDALQGRLYVFGPGEASECIYKIQDMLNSARVFELRAPDNRITLGGQILILTVPGVGSDSLEVFPKHYQKDREEPTAVGLPTSGKEWEIRFSEPVEGAKALSNYEVICGSEQIPVYAVDYNEEELSAILVFQEVLPGGEYHVRFHNIKDISMEGNPLSGEVYIRVPGREELGTEIETEWDTESGTEAVTEFIPEETDLSNYGDGFGFALPLAGTAIFFVAVAGVLSVLFLWRKSPGKQKRPDPDEEGSPDNMDFPLKQSRLSFRIRNGDEEKTKRLVIQDRLVAGRSSRCDLSVLDGLLSRRHFMIEKDGGSFYISDLRTTNGTMVNGIRILSRYKLKNGDVIRAGSLYITVTW